jgi:MoxR-like ATPase
MPSDITGTEILDEDPATRRRNFRFIPGPVFANIVLADEINRTPPKTQAALLEAMQEHKVTAAGVTYQLPEPFFVLATQNPIEQEGTYPLPEAQLDRFMFNLWLDYPSYQDEVKVVQTTTSEYKADLQKVITANELLEFQELVRKVPVADNVIEFAVKISNLTRPVNGSSPKYIKDWITWGAGPRASQYLILAAKAKSVIQGRFTPNIDDVRSAMLPVLRHRIITNFSAEAEGITAIDVIKKIVEETK